jgi:hypothetical protein
MAPIQPPFQGLKQRPVFRPKVVHFEVTRGGALWVIGDSWRHAGQLETVVQSVEQGMEVQFSGRVVGILDACPLKIVNVGFPFWENAIENAIPALRISLL